MMLITRCQSVGRGELVCRVGRLVECCSLALVRLLTFEPCPYVDLYNSCKSVMVGLKLKDTLCEARTERVSV